MPQWMRPTSDAATLPGELQLIATILNQAVHDAQSPSPPVRTEARTFLADLPALQFWLDLAEIEAEVFQARVDAALGRRENA